MPKVIGVRFKNVGKVYYFDPLDYEIHYHDAVIVETARGVEYGTVVLTAVEIEEEKIPQPLKPVIRKASHEDTEHELSNRQKEKDAYIICKQKIAERGLDMKLIEAEYTFDDSKVLFYFTAEGRIDFRELVKDLAGIFRTRIELRQIGVRDETKLLGGMGTCGRPLCCHTWLSEFAPVSIKMAKDQNLSLNPTKISGTCGRLMCCLKNEADTYASLNKGMPGKGDYVTTPEGLHGDVQSVNILRQTVKVIVELENDEKELREFEVKDITFVPKSKKPKPQGREVQKDIAEQGDVKSGTGSRESRKNRRERRTKDDGALPLENSESDSEKTDAGTVKNPEAGPAVQNAQTEENADGMSAEYGIEIGDAHRERGLSDVGIRDAHREGSNHGSDTRDEHPEKDGNGRDVRGERRERGRNANGPDARNEHRDRGGNGPDARSEHNERGERPNHRRRRRPHGEHPADSTSPDAGQAPRTEGGEA